MGKKTQEEKNAYHREYYKNNKDKIRLHNQRYWEKKAQETQAKTSDNIVKETKDKWREERNAYYREYKKNKDKRSENELRIRSKEFTGDLQPRSYKLYENVREALKDFTEQHKEYKAQDIVNKAIMEFITKYGN